MKIKDKSAFIISVLIPIAAGTLSALFSGGMSIYTEINKPQFAPPGFLFPIVWTILYILMGISSYVIYESDSIHKPKALTLYAVQLFFNFFWSILFFKFELYLPAFFWLLIMIVIITAMINCFYKINPLAAYLQIPYLLWCIFALFLNFAIYLLN